jgi:guanylate kinase
VAETRARPGVDEVASTDADWRLNDLSDRVDTHLATIRASRHPRLIVISGPSGVGKDTVIERLRERHPDAHYAVTATTRPPRDNERHGVHYYFLDPQTFAAKLAAGEFLESATVYGNQYGVLKEPIRAALAAGRDAIVKVDVQGAAAIRRLVPHGVFVFLAPETMSELLHRLCSRKTDDFAKLMERFNTASHELERLDEFDYVIFNEAGRLDRTLDQIGAIVAAEHCRINQAPIQL